MNEKQGADDILPLSVFDERVAAVAEGYRSMAAINLALAEEQFHLEQELDAFIPEFISGGG